MCFPQPTNALTVTVYEIKVSVTVSRKTDKEKYLEVKKSLDRY